MPTTEQNKDTVSTFAWEVFGNKNLDHVGTWLADDFVEHQVFPGTTPDKKGALDSYRIFFAASPDMTAEIHDMVAAGDKVAIPGHLPGDRQRRLHPRGARHRQDLRDGRHLPRPAQRAGPDRRALGSGRHHRHHEPARPAASPRPGPCLTALVRASPRTSRSAHRGSSRQERTRAAPIGLGRALAAAASRSCRAEQGHLWSIRLRCPHPEMQ